ncbi:hypothetical protein AKJ50_02055, partial [candidate division MSBL1 archaeon SCGC-AAA382A13]
PPEEGGSEQIFRQCEKLAIRPKNFLEKVLSEAKMKSEILKLAIEEGNKSFLELPFVTRSYGKYFSEVARYAPDYCKALSVWKEWMEDLDWKD